MIKVIIQKYHLKQQKLQKKAALISFLEPVKADNYSSLQGQLLKLTAESFDAYLLKVHNKVALNAFTLKVLLAFQNTLPGITGLLITEATKKFICYANLRSLFITAENPGALITKIETGKQARKSDNG